VIKTGQSRESPTNNWDYKRVAQKKGISLSKMATPEQSVLNAVRSSAEMPAASTIHQPVLGQSMQHSGTEMPVAAIQQFGQPMQRSAAEMPVAAIPQYSLPMQQQMVRPTAMMLPANYAQPSGFSGPQHVMMAGFQQMGPNGPPAQAAMPISSPTQPPVGTPAPSATQNQSSSTTPERWFNLGNQRYVSVKIWKGRLYVGIRQFVFESGVWKATRNGINLTQTEWSCMSSQINDVHKAVAELSPHAIYWP
jgi:hypothetical protein